MACEDARLNHYLHSSSREILIRTSETVLIKDHATSLQDQFQPLLERDKLDDLTRMFSLLSRVPDTLIRLREIFETHVREQGVLAIQKAASTSAEPGAEASGAATPAEEEAPTPSLKRKVCFSTIPIIQCKGSCCCRKW